MKYAVIDCGSNSVRLLLAEYIKPHFLYREKQLSMTRLGKNSSETKLLPAKSMEDSLNVIKGYITSASIFGASEIFMLATSAVRDSLNGIDFKNTVLSQTGIEMDILSGSEEALVGFIGASQFLETKETMLLIDIGGGSTEFIIGKGEDMLDAISIDIGAVRLTSTFVSHNPPLDSEIDSLKEYINTKLSAVKQLLKKYNPTVCAGIGGTITTFICMDKELEVYDESQISGSSISLESVKKINEKLIKLSIEERRNIKGLDPKRADIIVSGGLILQSIMETFDMEKVVASDYDNLEGYLVYRLNS